MKSKSDKRNDDMIFWRNIQYFSISVMIVDNYSVVYNNSYFKANLVQAYE